MNNIPTIMEEIQKLKQAQVEHINALTEIKEKIESFTYDWQSQCSHPKEYVSSKKCSACGINIEEL